MAVSVHTRQYFPPQAKYIQKWQVRNFRCRRATRIHCVNASVRSSEPYNFTLVMMRTNNFFRNWPRYGEKYTDPTIHIQTMAHKTLNCLELLCATSTYDFQHLICCGMCCGYYKSRHEQRIWTDFFISYFYNSSF